MAKKQQAQSVVSRANELKRAGAQAAGLHRTEVFYGKWRDAMRLIENEVKGNGGVYPQNDGKLTPSEIARRASVIVNSLYPARHAEFKLEVSRFIERIEALHPAVDPVEPPPASSWKEMYKATVANYQADALVWRSDRAHREAAEKRVSELEKVLAVHVATIERLSGQLASLTGDRVVPIKRK